MRFAVIGAGMAGLACADALVAAGHEVELFDKGRGAGGRMSTRRWQTPLGEVTLDHGAQYFTARDAAFRQLVRVWAGTGIAAPWPPGGDDAWVGIPGMNAVIRQMASSHRVSWAWLVKHLERRDGQWHLAGARGPAGPYDAVVLAIPAEQAVPLLALHDFAMMRAALNARSQPCWTGMFVFDRPLGGLPPVIRGQGALAWAARNSAKPGRPEPETWVVQASAQWSGERIEHAPEEVAELLLAALASATASPVPDPVAAAAHRWRYALSAGTGDGALWNGDIGLGACGDWLLGPRVECAWLSGRDLARQCLATACGAPLARGATARDGPTYTKGHV
ncbi:NAD(P)-binding protein [Tsuneonella sp. YG55]|uniref:NAD(P)-binding protein n=1 Tax=Tsuneonella litorea TaxID=2976475 RepID=A0A9X2W1Z9_9SPHN|nr:FAD-dependent oxidoreductase [Tsuneonella litorea]MCT2559341.1 NAD(P)-binding protein [Tsuneonella litorea]